MNDLESVSKAVKIIEKNQIKYALLHCTNYTTPSKLIRLNAIDELKEFQRAVLDYLIILQIIILVLLR